MGALSRLCSLVPRARVVAFVCSSIAVHGACSSSSAPAEGPRGPVAHFALAGDAPPPLLDVPFPSDAYLVGGKIVDPIPGVASLMPQNAEFLTRELGRLNGFGRATFSTFTIDDARRPADSDGVPGFADIDRASLPATEAACIADTSSVFLIDLAASDPGSARVRCRAAVHDDYDVSGARPTVVVGPGLGVLLEEGHRYAAVVTSRVKDKGGAAVGASADFDALRAGKRGGAVGAMYGEAIDRATSLLAGALASDGAKVVAIAPFTTQSTTHEMFKLRESLEATPAPKLAWDAAALAPMGAVKFAALVTGALPAGFTASLDDWLGVAPQKNGADDPDYLTTGVLAHDQIAAVGTARYLTPNFLLSKPGGYGTAGHATFARDAAGNIVASPDHPTVPVWVSFAVPKTPMPAGGYPCVIVAHGNPGSRAEMFMVLANALTAQGFLVAAIDAVTNGARAPEPEYQVDQLSDWEAAPGAKYKGPDGLSDGIDASKRPARFYPPTGLYDASRNPGLDFTGQGLNAGAARDQTLQQSIDVSSLARVLASDPDLSPLRTGATAPRIDPAKIAYIGGSMGAITGGVTAAFEPLVRTWVLNAIGAQSLVHASAASGFYAQLKLLGALVGITRQTLDETHPLAPLLQTAVDPADPLMFAPYLVKSPGTIKGQRLAPRNVLAIEVLFDETLANDGTESWARAAGIGLATPNVGPNAGVTTLESFRDPLKVVDRIALPDVLPDAQTLIHDTPVAGVTAVMVQTSGTHYRNIEFGRGQRAFAAPFNPSSAALATDKAYWVRHSYVAQWAMVTRFLADAFDGKVPNVTGFAPPVRDLDDDGSPDATDPDPNDPTVK
jgi:hypothetical protein